jgi:hypothetical protein
LPAAAAINQLKLQTMSRTFLHRAFLPLFAAGLVTLASCEKSDVSADKELLAGDIAQAKGQKAARAFKATTKTRYRISPVLGPAIDVPIGNEVYEGTIYFPGDGVGNATHMGRVTTYFNQLAYFPAGSPQGTPPSGSIAAALTAVPGYFVYVQPPSLIDFSRLTSLISALPIPTEVDGHIVNSMFVNDKNEAVFTTSLQGEGFIRTESPTRIVFGGKGKFLGGTGKFEGATGEFSFLGYFNPQNQDDAEYTADGWIKY